MQQEENQKKALSLRWDIVALVVVCWVLPLSLILLFSSYYVDRNLQTQVTEIMSASVESATAISRIKLSDAVNATLDASYIPTIKNAWQQYEKDEDWIKLYNDTRGFLNQQYYENRSFLLSGIVFLDEENHSVYTYNTGFATYEVQRAFYGKLKKQVVKMSETLGTQIAFIENEGRLYLVRCLVNNAFVPYAMQVMELNQEELFNGLLNLEWATDTQVQIDDCNITLLGEGIDIETLEIDDNDIPKVEQTDETQLLIYGQQKGERFTLRYYAHMDFADLFAEKSRSQILLWGIALLCIPFIGAVMVFFYFKVSRPVKKLVSVTKRIEAGELGAQVDDALGSSEFCYLGSQFNEMSSRLEYQFERIYREELALRDAKIMALQSQINPHFLNNTLEIINWEARIAGNVNVTQMLEALSTLLDAAMNRSKRSLIHLSEEMMYVDSYLYITGRRFGKRLTVTKEINPVLLDELVPRLIMQPIVENAIEHGVGGKPHGEIMIRTVVEDENWMRLEVENDAPLSEKDAQRIRTLLSEEMPAPGTGATQLGIRNVHQRLRILYGDRGGLSITMNKKGNTVSAIRVKLGEVEQ